MLLLRSPEKQVSEVICKLQGNHQQKQSYLCLQPSAHCFTVDDSTEYIFDVLIYRFGDYSN